MASPASKTTAEVWWGSRWLCQPHVSCLAITTHTGREPSKSSSSATSRRDAAGFPLHFLEVLRCNTHLEDLEHQKKVGCLLRKIQDSGRTPVCNVRLQTKINAGSLISSELLSFEEVNSLNCCMCVWVNMVQLLICCSTFDYV